MRIDGYLSRKELLDGLHSAIEDTDTDWCTDIDDIVDAIEEGVEKYIMELPSVDLAKQETGAWKNIDGYYRCTGCNRAEKRWRKPAFKYCPDCGALMMDEDA